MRSRFGRKYSALFIRLKNDRHQTFYRAYTTPSLSSWKFLSDRVILIGDAAHAISPSGGQGAAIAFEDGESLAYALDESQKHASALDNWERHRKERIKQVIEFTNTMANARQASQYWLVPVNLRMVCLGTAENERRRGLSLAIWI